MPTLRGGFVPPSQGEQLAAIGLSSDGKKLLETDFYDRTCIRKEGLWNALRCCVDPEGGSWEDLDPPQPSEWLDSQRTDDQSFRTYVASRPNRASRSQNTIYLQPLCAVGENTGPAYPDGPWPSWDILEAAATAFFAPMKVATLPAVPMQRLTPLPTNRNGPYGKQWHAGEVLDALVRKGLPKDAYGVMAVTMCDLYPKPEWNFVYGLARLQQRVGVFSFVRHTPTSAGTPEFLGAQLLYRSLKTLLHEIGHMFGLKHCTWYNCLMRGNNGEGVERQPNHLHLCPVCLRKLHWNIGFDIPTRYGRLLDIFQKYEKAYPDFAHDCAFLQHRLEALQGVQSDATLISDLVPKSRRPLSGGTSAKRSEKPEDILGRCPPKPKAQEVLSVCKARSKSFSGGVAPGRHVAAKVQDRSINSVGGARGESPPNYTMEGLELQLDKYARMARPSVQGKYPNSLRSAPAAKASLSRNGSSIIHNALPKKGSKVLSVPTCGCCAEEELVCPSCE